MIAAACLAVEEMTEEVRRENDRRYFLQRCVEAADRVLWWLEDLNLRDEVLVPDELDRRIRSALAELPAECLEVLARGRIEDVLDGVYAAQERLFCLRDPSRIVEEAGGYTEADLTSWAEVCRWLEAEGGVVPKQVPGDRQRALEMLESLGVTHLGKSGRWVVPAAWPARLERLRERLGEG
jgi:hypothetical protein